MVAFNDQRPLRPTDSLKRMVNNLSTPASVPHGVKVARPGEYVNFGDSSGSYHRWDGDAIVDFDQRIDEGRRAIDAATNSLNAAESDIQSARDRISQVEASTTTEAIAAGLNSKKLLIGRDAIFSGTVDVAQLNVTESMSAEMVKSMSAETRKLVVTDEAIMNRVTVIENIVTPELVAKKVSAALITGNTIQTSTESNKGVKIDSSGYKAYDSNGNLAVNLDGKNNRVVGTFSTSYESSSGVKISQKATAAAIDLFTPNWGGNATYQDSHAGIWYEVPADVNDRKLNIIAMDGKDRKWSDPGMLLWPGSGIGFQGQFVADSPAWKMGRLRSNSISPGGSTDWDVKFDNPMTGNSPVIFPMITCAANAVVSYMITKQSNSGFHLRVKNTDTWGTGDLRVFWLAIGSSVLNI